MLERGMYCANEPITDVQFRLKLEYSGPVPGVLHSYRDFTENTEALSPTSTLIEECNFKWQQKIHFTVPQLRARSDREQEQNTDQEEVTRNIVEGGSRIFTLVDGEVPAGIKKVRVNLEEPGTAVKYKRPIQDIKYLETGAGENKLAEKIAISRNRRIEPTTMSHRNPVIDLPNKEHQLKARSIHCIKQTMYIMAYLGPIQNNMDEYDQSNEYILCKIIAINGTNIILEPDLFSTRRTIESRYGIYKARLFLVKNEFNQIDDDDDDDNSDQQWFGGNEEGLTINDLPPEGSTKIIYLIDIERAVNFPHDGLHVEYKVDVPEQCTLTGLSPMYGWSPIGDSNAQGQDDAVVFSQPVCVTVIIKEGKQFFENFYWPRMTFRICAEDYWGRFFVDGYGFLMLPSQPGRYQFDVKCMKLVTNDKKSMLFEYYISQAADFNRTTDSILKTEFASSEIGTVASSVGLKTRTSGILKINVQCIIQSRKLIPHEFLQELKYGTVMRRIGMHTRIHWRILKVLAEFEAARRNLQKIRNQPIPIVNRKIQ